MRISFNSASAATFSTSVETSSIFVTIFNYETLLFNQLHRSFTYFCTVSDKIGSLLKKQDSKYLREIQKQKNLINLQFIN